MISPPPAAATNARPDRQSVSSIMAIDDRPPGLPAPHEQPGRTARVARNVVMVLASQIAVWIAGSGLAIVLPRYLGEANIGRLTFATSFTSLFVILSLFGSERYITREISRNPERGAHVAFNALVTRVPLVVASLLFIVAFVLLLDYARTTREVVYLFAASMCVTVVGNTCIAALQGLERMTLTSAAAIVEKVLSASLGVGAVVFAGEGMITYAIILLAANAVSVSIVMVYFLQVIGISGRIDLRECRAILRGGLPFLIWGISLMIYGTIDITMLSLMTNDDVVGWYGTSYRFIGIATFFPFSVTMALLPTISNSTREQSRALVQRCLDIVMFVSIPTAVFFLIGAHALIAFLHYPEGFNHSIILLRILSVHIPLTAFTMVAGTILIAYNKEGPRTWAAVAAAIFNPLINLAAIPYFQRMNGNGAIGAAIVSVVVEIFMVIVMLVLLERGTFDRSNVFRMIRSLSAGVPMAAVMILISPYGLIPMMVLGGITFVVAALAVKAITIDELHEMRSIVGVRGTNEGSAA